MAFRHVLTILSRTASILTSLWRMVYRGSLTGRFGPRLGYPATQGIITSGSCHRSHLDHGEDPNDSKVLENQDFYVSSLISVDRSFVLKLL